MSKDNKLEGYALNPEERKKELGDDFREHEKEERKDEFRTAYHRDRDRIIWSNAFRRLQNKTQVFAHDDDDHYRRRLTHSIEVAGIACSIARRLHLNEVATDAIALGHDIGHAPFGHAGEDALNEILRDNDILNQHFPEGVHEPIPLKGFDHCAHAIEVVSRIETLNGTNQGLDLSFDIRDGILKHIYHRERNADALTKKPFSALSEIVKCREYEEYKCNYGSLEAQCVWFADKLTYLFDDLEDAIRAKIFKFDIIKQIKIQGKLTNAAKIEFGGSENSMIEEAILDAMKPLECDIVKAARDAKLDKVLAEKFKKHYEEKYGQNGMKELYGRSDRIQKNHPDDDVRQFLFWRNKAMTVMIGDCVDATGKRINAECINSVEDVMNCGSRFVDVSDKLKETWRENAGNFYEKAMRETLFEHRIVLKHTYNAGQKIRRLFDIYSREDGYKLVPGDYKRTTKECYISVDFSVRSDNALEDIMRIITIRNYIAGMTDAYVNQKLQEYTA